MVTPTTHWRVGQNHPAFYHIVILGDLESFLKSLCFFIFRDATAVCQKDISDAIASEHLDDFLSSIHSVAALVQDTVNTVVCQLLVHFLYSRVYFLSRRKVQETPYETDLLKCKGKLGKQLSCQVGGLLILIWVDT